MNKAFGQTGIAGTPSFDPGNQIVQPQPDPNLNNNNNNNRFGGNQHNTLDGNNTLGLTYQASGCGLNYVYASQRLTRRFTAGPGVAQPAPFNITGLPCASSFVCLRAYLYWGVEGGPGTGSVTVTNPAGSTNTFPGTRIGFVAGGKCWGYGSSHGFRADVTAHISGNGVYTISGLPTVPPLSQHDTDGATLIIVYRDLGATYEGHIVMHDGLITQNGGTRNYTINNVNACAASTAASAMCITGDMQNNIAANHFAVMNGGPNLAIPQNFWNTDVRTAPGQIPQVTAGQMNSAFTISAPSDCYSWLLAMLYFQTTTCITCTPQPTVANAGPDTSICNGTPVQLQATGGIAYSWSPATGLSATNVSNPFANPAVTTTYTVGVTVSPGCIEFDQVVVTVNGSPTVTLTGNNGPYCLNNPAISLTGNPPGGTFSGPGIVLNTFNPATAGVGTHSIQYTYIAPNSCSNIANTSIVVQPPINGNTVIQNQTICSGSIPAIISGTSPGGGSGVYTYEWQSSADQLNWFTIPGATQVDYTQATVMISSAYFRRLVYSGVCTPDISAWVSVQVNPPITDNVINASQTICSGQTPTLLSGSNPSGGAWAYTYDWQSSADQVAWASLGTNSLNYQPPALTTHAYYRRIVSSTLCDPNTSAILQVQVNPIPTVIATNDVICLGQTAQIEATPNLSGGTFLWSSGQTTQTILVSPTISTTYSVTYTLNGCSGPPADGVVTVNFAPQPNIAPSGSTALCPGQSVTLTSDLAAQYVWTPGGFISQSITVGDAGTYCVEITDFNGCISSNCIIVTANPIPVLSPNQTAVSCFGGSNGQASVTVVSGPPNYQYLWNTVPPQVTQTAVGLVAGTYSVTVIDGNTCEATATIEVTQPLAPLGVTGTASDALCFNGNQGNITASAFDGTPGYTYSWNSVPPQVGAQATGLPAGNYVVTATDANGCTATENFVIGQPPAIVVNVVTRPVTCVGAADGSASVQAGGGTPGYTFLWSNGNSGSATGGLTAGTHFVTVTDIHGCQATEPLIVASPAPLTVQLVSTPVSCNGDSDGSLTASPNGGTPGYFYLWNTEPVQTTPTAIQLTAASTYSVRITDGNGCTVSANGSVSEPAPLVLSTSAQSPTCFMGNDGSVTVTVTGGNPPYSYRWNTTNPNQTTTTAINLPAGIYQVTVHDTKACVDTAWDRLSQPMRVPNPVGFPDTVCSGEEAQLGANAAPGLTIFWYQHPQTGDAFYSGTSYVTPPLNGSRNYFIQAQDDKGCSSPRIPLPVYVGNPPVADFDADKYRDELPGAVFQFRDKSYSSSGIYSWAWEFGEGQTSDFRHPVHEYSEVGKYDIKLTIVDSAGCRAENSKSAFVEVFMNVMMVTPNAFTPNGDGVNDFFLLEHYNIQAWTVEIYDRWGNMVYKSGLLDFRWDGTSQGQPAPEGVYVYYCRGIARDGTPVERTDSFLLLR